MRKWAERPMGSWVRIGMSMAVLPLLVSMVVVHFMMANQALGAFDDVAQRYRDERAPVAELRIGIWESAVHVEAFLESRQDTHLSSYRAQRIAIEGNFARLERGLADDPALG